MRPIIGPIPSSSYKELGIIALRANKDINPLQRSDDLSTDEFCSTDGLKLSGKHATGYVKVSGCIKPMVEDSMNREGDMKKSKSICPFSGVACKDCALYRGRHHNLCFSGHHEHTKNRGSVVKNKSVEQKDS